VVQRSQQEDGIGAGLLGRQCPRVAERRGVPLRYTGDVLRYRVDEAYPVSGPRERSGVHAGRAADVEDVGGWARQLAAQHVPRTQELQPALPLAQPYPFAAAQVVLQDLRCQHDPILLAEPRRRKRLAWARDR
jgi:hypothetical protein